ncbi:uncharacterized protein LOC131843257 [Achroia grisella]|uniref:uncharacterized protein LOC131843257 n=1 Tax=Achroia grisella TaxID=688607 RepID=UPI0027D34E12|nr:uncharacterized protein LOC131843257 [Achroia grisella]
MSDVKQVKVDNWGIYFLQRLKHFFNRTDYCDLILQFQDNAQLKVHRLVLNACTEYFELLERTCEMYEDCLVMPDDLQADVVVPIVNFMYTGQLEFKMDTLEKLYQTSLIMNMPVLSKLLEAHRVHPIKTSTQNYSASKRSSKSNNFNKQTFQPSHPTSSSSSNKRSYGKAFENSYSATNKEKKKVLPSKSDTQESTTISSFPTSTTQQEPATSKKHIFVNSRPTRYELPEELDTDNIFENSFASISYTSKPLMVHPDTTKRYPAKKSGIFRDPLDPKRASNRTSTLDIVECKKIIKTDIFEDDNLGDEIDDNDIFSSNYSKVELRKDQNQLFDQILDNRDGPKVTIESKDNKQVNNIDHAKIISEVLKKYPHLMKSNKNIKLKILNTPSKTKKLKPITIEEKEVKPKMDTADFTYETDVLDFKEAAKLIAMGAENVKGPWICLICGTPGRALHFPSYYKFRRHLVNIHNEKPMSTICEYCGFKSYKRNYMLYHMYTKHDIEPPPQFKFPKCNICNYVAINEGFLVKHRLTHSDQRNFKCNACSTFFNTSNQLMTHFQKTGHRQNADKKSGLQCIYCHKIFLRDSNLYSHLRTCHKQAAKRDGVIDDSDDDKHMEEKPKVNHGFVKSESYDNESEDIDVQFQIQQRPDGNIHVVPKKSRVQPVQIQKQKILNAGFSTPALKVQQGQKPKVNRHLSIHHEYSQDSDPSPQNILNEENVVVIDNIDYIMRDNQLIPRKTKIPENEYVIPEIMNTDGEASKMILKKSNIGQPIQIVVSNEEEYKTLMSSNHSIIFDNGNTNKTLTVLAAPHSTSLDTTTIDLDNTQSNDMMIIQDEYPLNVSEAVVTDNSNIVVVYSHQMGHVDDSDKQYQIISSQDIGAQYVQSSAMITQNYETVTTSTPVMSAHIIDAQVEESWQNNTAQNLQNKQINVTQETPIQTIPQTTPEATNNETETTLIELPEVQLIPVSKEIPAELSEMHNALNHPNVIDIQNIVEKDNTEEIQELVIKDVQNPMSTSSENTPCETMSEKEITTASAIDTPSKATVDSQNDSIMENSIQILSETTVPSVVQQTISAHNYPDIINETKALDEQTVENNLCTDGIVQDMENPSEPPNIAETIPLNQINHITPNTAKVQVQNLASEWSEDEYEATTQDSSEVNENTDSVIDNTTAVAEGNPPEIEESIENIQQEMAKQLAGDSETDVTEMVKTSHETIDIANTSSHDNIIHLDTDVQLPSNIVNNTEGGQEKLTSLLNDWDDNDSQEENNSSNANECEEENECEHGNELEQEIESEQGIECEQENNDQVVSLENNTTTTENVPGVISDAAIIKPNSSKDNNITKLVSDWDDDEEENKA